MNLADLSDEVKPYIDKARSEAAETASWSSMSREQRTDLILEKAKLKLRELSQYADAPSTQSMLKDYARRISV